MPMQVAVFHPGTQHSWQTALALQQLERLTWYATSIFYQPDRFPYRLERMVPGALAHRLQQEFRRFNHSGLDPALVRTVGLAEWAERIAARAGMRRLALRIDAWGNARFVSQIAGAIAGPEPFALWGYNGSSRSSFELARQHGRTCILDRTNGDSRVYNALMAEVAERYGDWFLPTERAVSARDIANDQREYELADRILVGSPFAAGTIRQACPDPAIAAKLQVLNYCFDEALFAGLPTPKPGDRSRPVRFLFMGLAIPRKGIHHVFEAISQLPASAAELTIVGDLKVPPRAFAPYADRVTYRPTVARADVPAIMAAHDVLLLPSYFEGSSLTLLEALASGMAIIQSDSAGSGVTSDTGLLLTEVNTETLLAAMELAIRDRDRLDHWRAHAQAEAQNYSFVRYRDNIAALLKDLESQG
jgi:glycosyltransferase involved in cell wall biosynthesis